MMIDWYLATVFASLLVLVLLVQLLKSVLSCLILFLIVLHPMSLVLLTHQKLLHLLVVLGILMASVVHHEVAVGFWFYKLFIVLFDHVSDLSSG